MSGDAFARGSDFNRNPVNGKIVPMIPGIYGHATVYSDSVDFELRSLPLPLAEKLMLAFNEYKEEQNDKS